MLQIYKSARIVAVAQISVNQEKAPIYGAFAVLLFYNSCNFSKSVGIACIPTL